jgi:hypothetical protein
MNTHNHPNAVRKGDQEQFYLQNEMVSQYLQYSGYSLPVYSRSDQVQQSATPLISPASTPIVSFVRPVSRNEVGLSSPALGPALMGNNMNYDEQTSQGMGEGLEGPFSPMTPFQLMMQMEDNRFVTNEGGFAMERTASTRTNPDPTLFNEAKKECYSKPYEPQPPLVKKPSHKEAEQKRRDKLKNHFKIVKKVLPGSGNKNMTKISILRKARNSILDLKFDCDQKEVHVGLLKSHIEKINEVLRMAGEVPPPAPAFKYTKRPKEQEQDSSDDE